MARPSVQKDRTYQLRKLREARQALDDIGAEIPAEDALPLYWRGDWPESAGLYWILEKPREPNATCRIRLADFRREASGDLTAYSVATNFPLLYPPRGYKPREGLWFAGPLQGPPKGMPEYM